MTRFAILLPALGLAACGHAAAGGNAAAPAAGPDAFTPGHYEMTYTITKIETPGMPQAAQVAMQTMGKPTVTALCITPEQAKKPGASIFGGGNCSYDHLSMAAGSIDVTTTCKSGATTAHAAMKGRFDANGFHLDAHNEAQGAGPVGRMVMTATVDAKRTGDCTGTEAS